MNSRVAGILIIVAFLAGCATAPQQPIALKDNSLNAQSGSVAVGMTRMPKVDTEFPGAACLLCIAAASIANSSLTEHTQKLSYEDLPKLKQEVADALRKKGVQVVVIAEDLDLESLPAASTSEPNFALKNFTVLKQKLNADRLLVIEVNTLGMVRTYSAYFPTSDPKATLRGAGYIVNLNDNRLEWYLPVGISRGASGPWDEPPKFPGLTNAYYQVIEQGRDAILAPFLK